MSSGLKGYSKPWGDGKIKTIMSLTTAGNATISIAVPAGKTWVITSFCHNVITDATVATRRPEYRMVRGADILYNNHSVISQGASLIYSYRSTLNTTDITGFLGGTVSLINTPFLEGDVFRTLLTGGVVGDSHNIIINYVEYDA